MKRTPEQEARRVARIAADAKKLEAMPAEERARAVARHDVRRSSDATEVSGYTLTDANVAMFRRRAEHGLGSYDSGDIMLLVATIETLRAREERRTNSDQDTKHADVPGRGASARGDAPAVADVGGAAGPSAGPHQAAGDDASGDAGGARVGRGDPGLAPRVALITSDATAREVERAKHPLGPCCLFGRCDGEKCSCACHPGNSDRVTDYATAHGSPCDYALGFEDAIEQCADYVGSFDLAKTFRSFTCNGHGASSPKRSAGNG